MRATLFAAIGAGRGKCGRYRIELDLDEASVQRFTEQPRFLVRIVEKRSVDTSAKLGDIALSLFNHEGRLAWRVLQEIGTSNLRTMFLDASDGRLLYEKP